MSSCGQPPQSGQRHLVAFSTTVVYDWFTPWRPSIGVRNVKAVLKRRGVSGNFQAQLAIQVAPVRSDKPNDPSTVGSMGAGNGEACTGVVDVSATTGGNFFVRYGVAYSLSSGSTAGQGDVTLEVADDGCGGIAGTGSFSLQTQTTSDSFVPLTGWLSALDAEKVKLAVVCASLSGNFQWRICYRTAPTSTQDPGAWSTSFDAFRGAGEVCTGELSPSVSGDMYVQLGIQYSLSSGSALGQATIHAVASARKG